MKLIRFGVLGNEKPGVQLSNGKLIDVSSYVHDFDRAFFENDGIEKLRTWLESNQNTCIEVPKETRLGAPIRECGKIICVGLNYLDHAEESGMEIPKEPVLFFKATSAICGPNDDLEYPKNAEKVDWEVELAIVIGKEAKYISEENAYDHIAGYVLHNDYSERAFQLEQGGQWVKGKSCDTFAPLGPWIATQEEIEDPHNLDLWLKVNDELVQQGNTSKLIFDIPKIVSYVSQFMSLQGGDIISTGTPKGVGLGFNPPRYLSKGDRVSLGNEFLGTSSQRVV